MATLGSRQDNGGEAMKPDEGAAGTGDWIDDLIDEAINR